MAGHSWRHFDPLILIAALALAGYGALVIYSASLPRGAEGVVLSSAVQRHIIFALVGAVLMIALTRLDYRLIDALGWLAYGFGIIVLVAVLFLGSDEFGSRRWFNLGFTVVQASEIGKLMTIIGLAKFLTDFRDRLQEFRIFLLSLGIAALPAALVFIEPDAGSAVVFMALWLVMTLFAGARLRHYAMLAAIGLCLVPVGLAAGVQDYQRDRIRAFIDPESDPQGAGFNVIQAETSVGSGGLWGQGLTEGTQTQLDFVRIQTTDFIFSVLSEELGFVGAMALFILFLLLLSRMLRVATRAGEPLGQLLAVGLITIIAVQVFINVAINIRLIPVTGIPLPFISTGNSSLLVFFIGLGLLQSVLAWQDDARRGPVY
ncbi:MAG: rod shape-determining protein RodA [Chloroflexi bacterium]|nr:rod shape-determining protein RodA [Chloroflexota bacterium]MYG90304.1 rod shape-determining protein RodA [Chloroflexota bacterium]MYJ93726.1 rod shape-determining protein RodA [Chloroflexota bacterium]